MMILLCVFSSYTTISLLTASLLQTLLLPADTARARTSSRISPELFGVVDMVPDKRPAALIEGSDETSRAWAEVKAVILDRLVDVQDGLAENFCWVSHEEILDDRNLVSEGGLVAVVQKQSAWRVNFYRMQQFKTWVQVKQLDLGSNRNFADETDVWVVRLTDVTEESKDVLPKLDGAPASRARSDRVARQQNWAARMRQAHFLRSLSQLHVGQGALIPALVALAQRFTFRLEQETSVFRLQNHWRWALVRFRFGQDAPSHSVEGDGLPVLKGFSRRFSADAPWTVSDNSGRALFTMEPHQNGTEYRLLSRTDSTTLYTIRLNRRSEQDLVSDGRWRWECDVDVFHGAGADMLYHGRTSQSLDGSLPFYSGHRPEALGTRVAEFDPETRMFMTYDSVDSALLLVASALAFS
eukprot:TRINITY_DN5211_c0_g1_i1.p1 TRINITY_DN5211_c0_g1~~TRINITY_DN5211_c0_g1_i1.p1  ORF type:complete len:411 (+),score=42.38 TRINITY_DN5211_c0_g1_i1:54-1286(+)